jgi:hypothetical protein
MVMAGNRGVVKKRGSMRIFLKVTYSFTGMPQKENPWFSDAKYENTQFSYLKSCLILVG